MRARLRRLFGDAGLDELARAFREHDLFTFAAAISFRVLFATIPFTMFVLAVLGFLHLDEVWAREVAPDVKDSVAPAVYRVLDEVVRRALSGQQLFWATAGGAIALWITSGAVRAAMDALDELYQAPRERPLVQRYLRSMWLAVAVGGCFLAAAAIVRLGPLAIHQGRDDVLLGVVSFLIRWGIAAALLGLAVFLVVRYAPLEPQPVRWVSRGTIFSVAAWIVMSLAFGAYVQGLASYGSVYGSLSSVMVALTYLYLSAIAFLFGVQVDAVARE